MSTTDTRAAFKAWAEREGYDTAHTHDGIKWLWLNPMTADLSKAYQAATEAAKATGTAGELPPLPEGKLYDTPAGPMHRYTINQMREYGGKCADAARNLAIEQAEAARQPAPVVAVSERDMMIAQAVRQACVNSYGPDDSASDYAEKMGDIDLATVIRAATNRSQP